MRIADGMVMKRIAVIILFILFISEICFAEVYRWMDEKGAIHFTDDITQVPERYRSKTEEIGFSQFRREFVSQLGFPSEVVRGVKGNGSC